MPRSVRSWRELNEPRYIVSLLLLMTLVAIATLTVNPWPRDDWFESRDLLFAQSLGADNYVPITVPTLLFKCAQWLATAADLGLRGEFYLASIMHNLLLFLSAGFVYGGARALGLRNAAGIAAVLYLAYLQSVGVAQAMWSENAAVFLFAVALYVNLKLYRDGDGPGFWRRTLWSAFVVGLLVITRVTPVFMIPVVALLLWGRVGRARLVAHLLIVSVTTVGLVVLAMWSNEWRFGRFELTNSSGRHLWQGVTYMDDAALASSPTLRALRQLNPRLRRSNWWEVKLPDGLTFMTGGDELLGRAAKDAIRADPAGYLALGVEKFAKDVYIPVYRLGFEPKHGHPNPLDTDVPLPALASLDGAVLARIAAALAGVNERAFYAGDNLFRVAIYLVLSTFACWLFQRSTRRPLRTLGQLAAGVALLLLLAVNKTSPAPFVVYALCVVVLLPQLAYLACAKIDEQRRPGPLPDLDGWLYGVLAAMYFGSLWFSWQVEMPNSRNILPYLPFLAILGAYALTHWARAVGSLFFGGSTAGRVRAYAMCRAARLKGRS